MNENVFCKADETTGISKTEKAGAEQRCIYTGSVFSQVHFTL